MNKMINDKKQKGFTLIEIIAVLVLLGILAAVAVPRFIGMQQEARTSGLQQVVASAQSNAAMEFSRQLLLHDGSSSLAFTEMDLTNVRAVQTDGWLDDAEITTTVAGDVINIRVTHPSAESAASGTFTRP